MKPANEEFQGFDGREPIAGPSALPRQACTFRLRQSATPFVTEALSRGLARQAIPLLVDQGKRWCVGVRAISKSTVGSKKAVAKMTANLQQVGHRSRLVQVIGRTPNGRRSTVCAFVPRYFKPEGVSRPAVLFDLMQLHVSVKGMEVGFDVGTPLLVTEHALERMFLRLNTVGLGLMYQEVHDAVLMSPCVKRVGSALGLRQLPLLTRAGFFRCDLDVDSEIVVAKTWIPDRLERGRWAPVVETIRDSLSQAGGEAAFAHYLGQGMFGPLKDVDHEVVAALTQSLSRFPWLREGHAQRPDPVGRKWAMARRAANAASFDDQENGAALRVSLSTDT